jgi:hypothetical protein
MGRRFGVLVRNINDLHGSAPLRSVLKPWPGRTPDDVIKAIITATQRPEVRRVKAG